MWAPTPKPLHSTDYFVVKRLFQDVFDLTEDKYLPAVWKDRERENSLGIWHPDGALMATALVRGHVLEYICVSPHAQGDGLGTILLNAVIQRCPALHLTPVNDDRVIRWYERHGFVLTAQDGDKLTYSRYPWSLRSRIKRASLDLHLLLKPHAWNDRSETSVSA